MGRAKIGAKIVLEGEAEYRNALKNINAAQKENRSEMKLWSAEFKENQNCTEALTKKHEILTKQLETQKQKVEACEAVLAKNTKAEESAAQKVKELQTAYNKATKELEKMESSADTTNESLENQKKQVEDLKNKLQLAESGYDATTRKVSEYQTSLNYAQAEQRAMESELGRTEKYLKEAQEATEGNATSIDRYGKEVQEATQDTSTFGDIMKANLASDVISSGLSKLADLAKQAGEALVECAVGAAQYADDIATTATNTGIAAETLQELTYAQELMDVNLDTVTSAMAKNIKAMESARKGSADYAAAYRSLGVEVTDVTNGQLRDSETVFWEVVDALAEIENETTRDATAMQIFGKKAQDLNSLITIGSGGFKELAAEAHKTGFVLSDDVLNNLLKTSDAMERMKNRITGVKNNIGGELAPVFEKAFNRIGDVVEDAEDEIIDLAEDAIPLAIDGLEWIIDNADLIISGVAGIAAASVEMKVVAPAVETVTTAWNAYKTANEGATVSQWLLNTAMNANPAGLLITGIVALTTAVGAYVIINKDNLSVTDEVTKKTNEQVKAAQELNDTLATAKTERESNRQSMEKETAVCQNLVKELKELQAKTSLTASEQARQRMIVDQLNEALPELNIAIDEQTGELNKSTDAIEDNVEAMLAMAKVEAAREDLIEIAEQQYEAEKQLTEFQEQREEQLDAVKAAQEELNNVMTRYDEIQAKSQVQRSEKALEELDQQIKATQESIDGFTTEYAETMEYIEDTEELATATAATQELGNAAETTGGQITGMSAEAQQAYQEMAENLNETITSQMSLFEEFDAKSELSTQQLLANMESQVEGISQWSDNIKELADRGIDQGLLQTLAEMGPEGAGYVKTFVSMTDEELQKANDLYKESLTLPDETTNEIMQSYSDAGTTAGEGFITGTSDILQKSGDLMQSFSEVGTMAGEGFINGISNMRADANKAAEDFSKGLITTSRRTLRINSPSKETEEIGEYFDEGLGSGINKGKQVVIDIISNLCADMINTTKNKLPIKSFETIGKQIPEGLVTGINNGKADVLKAIEEMCTEAVAKAEKGMAMVNMTKSVTSSSQVSTKSLASEMSDVKSVIAMSLPETAMRQNNNLQQAGISDSNFKSTNNIHQDIHIYSTQDNIIETAAKFKRAQREAAEEW